MRSFLIGEFKTEEQELFKVWRRQAAQMVIYQNQPRFVNRRSLLGGRRPGSLSSCVAGNVFTQRVLFEMDALPMKA